MTIPGATLGSRYLRFQKALIFVCGGSADVADPCQFVDVQLSVFIGRDSAGENLRGCPLYSPAVAPFLDLSR